MRLTPVLLALAFETADNLKCAIRATAKVLNQTSIGAAMAAGRGLVVRISSVAGHVGLQRSAPF